MDLRFFRKCFHFFDIANEEFFPEMFSFVHYLSCGYGDFLWFFDDREFWSIKIISPWFCFFYYFVKILIYRLYRVFCSFESCELRMIFISFCFPFEYVLREKSFAPHREKSLRIEISRMESPETHEVIEKKNVPEFYLKRAKLQKWFSRPRITTFQKLRDRVFSLRVFLNL